MNPRGLFVTLCCCLMSTGSAVETLDCRTGNCVDVRTRNDEKNLHVVSSHASPPAERPKSLNMIHEDDMDFRPTTSPTVSDEPKGRSLNFTMSELNNENNNVLSVNLTNDGMVKKKIDLSDVDMDNEDEKDDFEMSLAVQPLSHAKIHTLETAKNKTNGACEKGGLTYENGEVLEIDCDLRCKCTNGHMDCTDRCSTPYFRRGKKIEDPLCSEHLSDDPCCALLTCADTATEPLEMCSYKNKTYHRGQKIKDDCVEMCVCDIAGKVSCKQRCPPVNKTSEKCVEIPDPNDSCCKTVLCDVTLNDHESERDDETTHRDKIRSATLTNGTVLRIEFENAVESDEDRPHVDVSYDQKNWTTYVLPQNDQLSGFAGPIRYVRVEDDRNGVVEIKNWKTWKISDEDHGEVNGSGCEYKSRHYTLGQEFDDGCESFCLCKESGVDCLKIECPTYFGVDVLDSSCIEWETVPPNFVPVPPNCCPSKLRCKSNGSCEHEDTVYANWQEIPSNVTGCDKKCYCEMGKIECQHVCPPVPGLPPNNLPCAAHQATLRHHPGDDCCLYWMCNSEEMPMGKPNKSDGKVKQNSKNELIDTATAPAKSKKPFEPKNATDESPPFLGPLEPRPSKTPSKTLGPLTVYGNMEHNSHNISSDENHYFNKIKATKIDLSGEKTPNMYLDYNIHTHTHGDLNRTKSGDTRYGTLPANAIHVIPFVQNHQDKGTPEELLQIINQHPDFANYPAGSILEIHNVPQSGTQDQHYLDPNAIIPINDANPIVPYTVNQYPHRPLNLGDFPIDLFPKANKARPKPFPQFALPNAVAPSAGQHELILQHNGPIYGDVQQHNVTAQGIPFGGGFPNTPGYQNQDEIIVRTLQAIDAHTVRLTFNIPPLLVGLHGRVEVRYTHRKDEDPNSWELQVFAPSGDLLATPEFEFDLPDLHADTEYRIKVSITLRDVNNTPSSAVHTVRTLKELTTPAPTPPVIPIEPDLSVSEVNATWASVTWRKFTEYELQFIDGVQLRYKEIEGKIYAATPLIHRAVTGHTLENLKPRTQYEVGIFFIPFPGQLTELRAEHAVHFHTGDEMDSYGFNVSVEVTVVKSTSVEIAWSGVPYPEDKYVNIYRAIYQSDSGKGDSSTFKVAKRDSPAKTMIKDLKPGTRYRLWLEVYLTNGRIKTSNVKDFITKPGSTPVLGASSHDKLSSGDLSEARSDYYGPLVIVAILATVAILSTLVLLLILLKRHNQNKASITNGPRVSQSAYDNPTYKVEIQQETMDL